jgi:mannose-1-phosphate guanylyltransferase
MAESSRASVRCGIILSWGDGERLRPFVRRLRGDDLPKQYVDFTGAGSLFEHTVRRAETLIAPSRLFTVVSRDHFAYPEVWRQLADRPGGRVVAQPENRDTAPGLLLPLAHLSARYPDAVVAVFPSDHHLDDDGTFMAHVDLACRVVERRVSHVVFLGVEPTGPDPEYGYILPGDPASHPAVTGLRHVRRFVEKPDAGRAGDLVRRGGLWNTFVMVFRAETLWAFVREAAPVLSGAFGRIRLAVGTTAERAITEEVYRRLPPMNFSRGLLRALPSREFPWLTVLPVRGVTFSDCGAEARLPAAMRPAEPLAQPLCA